MAVNETFVYEFSASNGVVENIFEAAWMLTVFILNVSTNIVVIGATCRKAIYCSHIALFVIKNLAISNLLVGFVAIGPSFAVICRNKADFLSCLVLDNAKAPLVIQSAFFSMLVNLEKLLSMNKPIMARKLSLWPRGYLYVISPWTVTIAVTIWRQWKKYNSLSYDSAADMCMIEIPALTAGTMVVKTSYLVILYACPIIANIVICFIMARRVSVRTTIKSQQVQRGAVKALVSIAIIEFVTSMPLLASLFLSVLNSPLRNVPELSFLVHNRYRTFVINIVYIKSCTTGIIFYATLKSFRLYVNRIVWKKVCDSIRLRLIYIRVDRQRTPGSVTRY